MLWYLTCSVAAVIGPFVASGRWWAGWLTAWSGADGGGAKLLLSLWVVVASQSDVQHEHTSREERDLTGGHRRSRSSGLFAGPAGRGRSRFCSWSGSFILTGFGASGSVPAAAEISALPDSC